MKRKRVTFMALIRLNPWEFRWVRLKGWTALVPRWPPGRFFVARLPSSSLWAVFEPLTGQQISDPARTRSIAEGYARYAFLTHTAREALYMIRRSLAEHGPAPRPIEGWLSLQEAD